MNEKEMNCSLGIFLRDFLKKNSLSIGKLSKLSKIDKATLSRIINNKQRANINHLSKISKSLNISLKKLLHLAGYNLEDNLKEENKIMCNKLIIEEKCDDIDSLFKVTKLIGTSEVEALVSNELKKYEEYAKTNEGSTLIHEDFNNKIKKLKGSGVFIEKLEQLYERFCMKNTSIKEKILIGSALLYFITVPDVLPDFIIPIGFLDDFIALKIVLNTTNIND